MRNVIRFGFLLWASLVTPLRAVPPPSCEAFPGSQAEGSPHVYTVDTLYEYINGQSEGYFAYGFERLTGVVCRQAGLKVIIDIYEMKDAEAAWGVFASLRDPQLPYAQLGSGGQVQRAKAMFAKGKYWVEIAAEPPGEHSSLLESVARTLEKQLVGESAPPAPVSWFPAEGLNSKTVRLVPQSVLGLPQLKRGYVAEYENGARAFVIREESAEAASQLVAQMKTRLSANHVDRIGDEAVEGMNRYLGKVLIFRKGAFVGGVAGAPEGQAIALAKSLANRIP